MSGRVSLLPRHETAALRPDERAAVEMLETHLWQRTRRAHRAHRALEVLPDGVGVFLTVAHVQRVLRQIDAPKTGEKFAAHVINDLLPRLGLIEDTGGVKKPRVRTAHPGQQREDGGRHAQPNAARSYWWRVFRLPTLDCMFTPRTGAYPSAPGTPVGRPRISASLSALLRCQGLPARSRRWGQPSPGSPRAAFEATGPP
jgi:hypothetical protein